MHDVGRRHWRSRFLFFCAIVATGPACNSAPLNAGAESADVGMPQDLFSTGNVDGGVICGVLRCAPDTQYCFSVQFGDGGIRSECSLIDSFCKADLTCSCLGTRRYCTKPVCTFSGGGISVFCHY